MAQRNNRPPIARSRSASDHESVYNLANVAAPCAAPKVIVYNVAPAPSQGVRPIGNAADSSQVESFLNPVRGIRDAQQRAGIKPVNHVGKNASAVKEQSQLNALRKQQQESDSHLPPLAQRTRSSSAPNRRPSPGPEAGQNFIQMNKANAAAQSRPPRAESKEEKDRPLAKKDYGRVPKYLVDRKTEMAMQYEAQQLAKEAALIPPGMRVMPEEERLEMISILQRNREEILRLIQQLPFVIETPSQIRRKNDLEQRLREIEDAFKIFSRPKVLVHN